MKVLALLLVLGAGGPVVGQDGEVEPLAAQITLHSDVLDEDRVVIVRTPGGYASTDRRYPVLYMTDGPGHFLHTIASIEYLARDNRMPEMIVVAIGNVDRTRDLTPTRGHTMTPEGQSVEHATSGGADDFLRFIETELIPAIERNFRTQPYRVFAGHSLGGLFSIHAFASRTELFDAYIAVSPSLHWDDKLALRETEELIKNRKGKELKKTVFVSLGDEGDQMQANFEELQRILERNRSEGFEWKAMQFEDEDHLSVVLPSHYYGLRAIYAAWPLPRDPQTEDYLLDLDGLAKHYENLSGRYGYEIPVPERVINRIGYQELARLRFDEAIEIFDFNVKAHPASPNAYDSLGEAYEKAGRLKPAKANYEKAASVAKKQGSPAQPVYAQNLERVVQQLKKQAKTDAR